MVKTRDNAYVAVDAPSGFADWIYSKKPDIIITDLLITHQHFDHVEDACRMRQIFDCRIHAGQPYNESLTLEKMARDAWGLPLNVQPFVVDEILTPDIHTAILRTALFTICRMKESCSQVTSFLPAPSGGRISREETCAC